MTDVSLVTLHAFLWKDWKYDNKIKKHYVEVDEEGCLTKTYRQSDEWSETGECKTSKKRRKLTSGPMAADTGDSDVDDESEPDIQPEKQAGLNFILKSGIPKTFISGWCPWNRNKSECRMTKSNFKQFPLNGGSKINGGSKTFFLQSQENRVYGFKQGLGPISY